MKRLSGLLSSSHPHIAVSSSASSLADVDWGLGLHCSRVHVAEMVDRLLYGVSVCPVVVSSRCRLPRACQALTLKSLRMALTRMKSWRCRASTRQRSRLSVTSPTRVLPSLLAGSSTCIRDHLTQIWVRSMLQDKLQTGDRSSVKWMLVWQATSVVGLGVITFMAPPQRIFRTLTPSHVLCPGMLASVC